MFLNVIYWWRNTKLYSYISNKKYTVKLSYSNISMRYIKAVITFLAGKWYVCDSITENNFILNHLLFFIINVFRKFYSIFQISKNAKNFIRCLWLHDFNNDGLIQKEDLKTVIENICFPLTDDQFNR